MSRSKISISEARAIAELLSKKAFEHLIMPVEEEYTQLGAAAYKKIVEGLDEPTLNRLKELEIVTYSDSINIQINNDDESQPVRLDHRAESECLLASSAWRGPDATLNDDALWHAVVDNARKMRNLKNSRGELRAEIYQQIVGRTAKAVIEAWPEAQTFIEQIIPEKTVSKPEIVRPLEVVLGKYMPSLPAPTGGNHASAS